ncbi:MULTISPECIES: hypothetical protein [Jeotgalicoccus]|jgi:hypothetical protein|uniref:Uncharacterized protein n=1 Tax=Jeotgalicoccus nanhaiensis TaxID=568603 RepID=A0ABR9Y0C5_9STAP|nr:hypothetical protein [Jeotgalicoccus nanhaiensis]MBF0754149.1 hypothetical protein [Jeotgalicoccus nanhaiensis]TFU61630.1 hypothetical protein E4T89_07630 [Jeotgalicoccus nanhaiensis]
MSKEKISRFIFMYILVFVIIIAVQFVFLDEVSILNSLFMPAVVAFLSLAVRSNVKKDEEIAARESRNRSKD